MAKKGSLEWYRGKYDSAKAEVATLKAELKAAKASAPPDDALVVDTTFLNERNRQAITKFLTKSQRYARRDIGQIAASCLAYLADTTRRASVAGVIKSVKALPGSGLR